MSLAVVDWVSRQAVRLARRLRPSDPDVFLNNVTGVIHVGANSGQERKKYDRHGLSVVWVEPIPAVFASLQENIRKFPRQRAYRYLLTDREGQSHELKIANNGGASSSILDMALHKDIWPDIHYIKSITLTSATLSAMIVRERIEMHDYQALVMDTQGSELLVLKGAENLLAKFRYIKTEAPDFEAYAGCCLVSDLSAYLAGFGFREIQRTQFAGRQAGGSYFDIVYERSER